MIKNIKPLIMNDKSSFFDNLLTFLEKLAANRIHYTISYHLPQAISVLITVPDERWEVDFHQDGDIQIEAFRAYTGVQSGEEGKALLEDLFHRFSDAQTND
jgi:hypothetical protein